MLLASPNPPLFVLSAVGQLLAVADMRVESKTHMDESVRVLQVGWSQRNVGLGLGGGASWPPAPLAGPQVWRLAAATCPGHAACLCGVQSAV
jgi:hypothetical protein